MRVLIEKINYPITVNCATSFRTKRSFSISSSWCSLFIHIAIAVYKWIIGWFIIRIIELLLQPSFFELSKWTQRRSTWNGESRLRYSSIGCIIWRAEQGQLVLPVYSTATGRLIFDKGHISLRPPCMCSHFTHPFDFIHTKIRMLKTTVFWFKNAPSYQCVILRYLYYII